MFNNSDNLSIAERLKLINEKLTTIQKEKEDEIKNEEAFLVKIKNIKKVVQQELEMENNYTSIKEDFIPKIIDIQRLLYETLQEEELKMEKINEDKNEYRIKRSKTF